MIIFGKYTVIIGKSRQSSEIHPIKNPLMKTVTYCQQENLKQIEAATGGVQQEKFFLEIPQNSQENACARVSFLIKLKTEDCDFIKKETLAQVFFLWILRNL